MKNGIAAIWLVVAACGSSRAPATLSRLAGTPYVPSTYVTRIDPSSTEARLIYCVDPGEMDWTEQNLERVLQEVRLEPQQGGGILVAEIASGSIAASRGIEVGDVVKAIDGTPIRHLEDLHRALRASLDTRRHPLVVEIERAGSSRVIEYRRLRD